MNIETKTERRDISDYLKFGWEHTEDVGKGAHRSKHTAHVLVRDKDMRNYKLIAALENKYFNLKSQVKTYHPITESPEMFFLILLFVLPFIIYCVYKGNQKRAIDDKNDILAIRMLEVLDEVKPLL